MTAVDAIDAELQQTVSIVFQLRLELRALEGGTAMHSDAIERSSSISTKTSKQPVGEHIEDNIRKVQHITAAQGATGCVSQSFDHVKQNGN